MMRRLKSNYEFSDIRGTQDLKKLAWILGVTEDYLIELSVQKNNYYKPYVDNKGKKPRKIDQPTGELIALQTRIRDRILDLVPLSNVVFGAVPGKNTQMSASLHLNKDVVVKLDLKDCFHSSKARKVRQLFKKRFGFSDKVSHILTELCTYEGHIPVGSTLSSTLVNLILNPLWQRIDNYLKSKGSDTSTWVDDLAFSGKEAEKHMPEIKKMINQYGYRISWEKMEIQRKGSLQEVNGGCVNTKKVTVPKKKRVETAKAIKKNPDSDISMGKLTYVSTLSTTQGRQLKKLRKKLSKDS